MAKTLLLADDSVTIQKVVGISFASEDVTLITVDNGDDAITRAREVRPDAILADVVMPGKNGYEVCEAVKTDPALRHIPVLLLTGTFEAYDEERAGRVGASGHVAKPFEAQVLVDAVKRMFAEGARPATPQAPARPPATAPEAAAGDSDDTASDSFDFFDDELGAPADAGTAEKTQLLAGDDALDFDSDDDAFSLGEPEPPLSAGPGRRDAAAGAERTVIVPGAAGRAEAAARGKPGPETLSAAPAAPAAADPLDLDAANSRLSGAAEDFLAPDAAALLDDAPAPDSAADAMTETGPAVDTGPTEPLDTRPRGSFHPLHASGGDPDFDFEAPEPIAGDDPLMRVDSADLAEATVLDPAGASGFDVSSSDLGNAVSLSFDEPFEPPPTAVKAEAPWPAELPPLGEPARAAPPPPRAEPKLKPAPAPRAASAPTAAPAASAEAALSEIAPRLREQLHDTLEKIAWESFSDVTEKIVRQAVEKVEAIAWEVIPHLAETLVREEIRRMKAEIEND